MTWARWLTRKLWKGETVASPTRRQVTVFTKAEMLVSIFYAFNLAYAFYQASRWKKIDMQNGFDPVWSVTWAVGIPSVGLGLVLFSLTTATLACVFPKSRLARILAACGLYFHTAFINSFGAISHNAHVVVWAAIVFVFLPSSSKGKSRQYRQQYLFVFWAAQFLIMLFYTMSGGFKLLGAAYQFSIGEITAFHPSSMARHIASIQLNYDSKSMLGEPFVRYVGNLGGVLFVFSVLLEFGSVAAVFRPRWHRVWGLGLLAMHIGIGLTMDIWCDPHFFLVGLLFVNSPFLPEKEPLQLL